MSFAVDFSGNRVRPTLNALEDLVFAAKLALCSELQKPLYSLEVVKILFLPPC